MTNPFANMIKLPVDYDSCSNHICSHCGQELLLDVGEILMPRDTLKPEWHNVHKAHDWKNYVTDDLKNVWSTFSQIQTILIAEALQKIADAEEWE